MFRTSRLATSIFNYGKRMMPKMTETEKVALNAGTIGFDRDIFKGTPDVYSLINNYETVYRPEVKEFINETVEPFCQDIHSYEVTKAQDVDKYLWTNIKAMGLLGMAIPKKYGGLEFGTHERSQVIQTISSREPSVGVCVMVPNSLGPAELLLKYGTERQKNNYLPGLAKGDYIPCFGLTSPWAGSDAAGSMVDTGEVVSKDGVLGVNINCFKRYITLAPVSNLIGLAVKLHDPHHLLEDGREGITVLLIENENDPDIKIGKHDPLGAAFPNGTIRMEDKFVPIDSIIGGERMAGEGWRMLMECLAEGRSVSLPAGAVAGCKLATFGVGSYSRWREQFKVPIADMEGVQEKLADMVMNTYLVTSGQHLTNALLDKGEKPAVIGAIMKEQCTERAAHTIKLGMDIMGGAAICRGPNNFMSAGHTISPIGITVEGSNTLTRSLITFGQGLMRSHPHLYDMVKGLQEDNQEVFMDNLIGISKHGFKNAIGSFGKANYMPFISMFPLNNQNDPIDHYDMQLNRLSNCFALSADMMLLLGKKFKTAEMLSGRHADILSNIYLGYASLWYYHKFGSDDLKPILKYTMDTLLYESQETIIDICNNYPGLGGYVLKGLTFPYGRTYKKPSDAQKQLVSHLVTGDFTYRNTLKDGIFIPTDDSNLSLLSSLVITDEIRDKIIQVDEFDNKK